MYGRKKLLDGNESGFFAIGAALFVFTPLAALCKESGLLLPALILVCEATLLRWSVPDLSLIHIFTDSPTHRLTDSPTHRLTDISGLQGDDNRHTNKAYDSRNKWNSHKNP